MIEGKTVLGLIPARKGSKGVPRKNVRLLAGDPLIAWTIKAAAASAYIDRLIVSTDDEEVVQVAKARGCDVPFKRPAELAQDDSPGIDVVLHALEQVPDYDYVILLQPTSPLRSPRDIDCCLEYCLSDAAPACVSVSEVNKPPQWMYRMDERRHLKPFLVASQPLVRRQDAEKLYVLNGAVYVAGTAWLMQHHTFVTDETIAYLMPGARSVDIDAEEDFVIAEALLSLV